MFGCQGCSQRHLVSGEQRCSQFPVAGSRLPHSGVPELLETPDHTHLCVYTQCLQAEATTDGAPFGSFSLPLWRSSGSDGHLSRAETAMQRGRLHSGCPCPCQTAALWPWFKPLQHRLAQKRQGVRGQCLFPRCELWPLAGQNTTGFHPTVTNGRAVPLASGDPGAEQFSGPCPGEEQCF